MTEQARRWEELSAIEQLRSWEEAGGEAAAIARELISQLVKDHRKATAQMREIEKDAEQQRLKHDALQVRQDIEAQAADQKRLQEVHDARLVSSIREEARRDAESSHRHMMQVRIYWFGVTTLLIGMANVATIAIVAWHYADKGLTVPALGVGLVGLGITSAASLATSQVAKRVDRQDESDISRNRAE